jgi:hypothetical protein
VCVYLSECVCVCVCILVSMYMYEYLCVCMCVHLQVFAILRQFLAPVCYSHELYLRTYIRVLGKVTDMTLENCRVTDMMLQSYGYNAGYSRFTFIIAHSIGIASHSIGRA